MFNKNSKIFNEDSNSILLCNECHKEFLKITSIDYDEKINDYIITYQCLKRKSKESHKINLKKYLITQNSNFNLSKESPYYCPYHEYNQAPFYCPECNENLCKDCYNEHILFEQDESHFKKYEKKIKKCNLHQNKRIMNFCKKCDKDICYQCIKDIHFSHEDNWETIEDDAYIKYNLEINNSFKKVKNFFEKNMNMVNGIIHKVNQLKEYIENCYKEFLNTYLPIINLYKLYLFKSINTHSNELNNIINSFSFLNFDYKISEFNTYKTNMYISQKKNIQEDTLSKLSKEIKILDESINIYNKGINFFFSKFKFNFINKSSNYNCAFKIDNPFLVSNKPKKFFGCIKKLDNHKDEIYCLIKLKNGNFATGSGDGLVLIWDDYLLNLSLTIHAHKGGVNALNEMTNNKNILLTGGNDSTIQFWDINDDYNNIKKLILSGPIVNIFVITNEIFSCYSNNLLTLWSIEKYEKIFGEEINDIYTLEYLSDNNFVAGLEDTSIIIFNIFDTKMLYKKKLEGSSDIISYIKKIDEKYIISGNYDGDLIVWDLIKLELFFSIKKAHLYKINCIIKLNDGLFATCSNDKTIKIWNLHKRVNILTFFEAHEKTINNLIQLNNGMLVSAGKDSLIKIWN